MAERRLGHRRAARGAGGLAAGARALRRRGPPPGRGRRGSRRHEGSHLLPLRPGSPRRRRAGYRRAMGPSSPSTDRLMIDFARKLASTLDRNAADVVREALAGAGITIGGDAPWDLQVHDSRVYDRILREGTIGVGESF